MRKPVEGAPLARKVAAAEAAPAPAVSEENKAQHAARRPEVARGRWQTAVAAVWIWTHAAKLAARVQHLSARAVGWAKLEKWCGGFTALAESAGPGPLPFDVAHYYRPSVSRSCVGNEPWVASDGKVIQPVPGFGPDFARAPVVGDVVGVNNLTHFAVVALIDGEDYYLISGNGRGVNGDMRGQGNGVVLNIVGIGEIDAVFCSDINHRAAAPMVETSEIETAIGARFPDIRSESEAVEWIRKMLC